MLRRDSVSKCNFRDHILARQVFLAPIFVVRVQKLIVMKFDKISHL